MRLGEAGLGLCLTATGICALVMGCGMNQTTGRSNQSEGLRRGLVAWYPLDGNARDASGHGHDGKVIGAAPTADRFGKPEAAYAFDGEDDEILIDPPPPLSAQAITVSVWASFNMPAQYSRWVDIGDGGIKLRDPIIGMDDGYSIRCFQLWLWGEDQASILWHRMCEYSSCWTKWKVQAGRWYHIVATFDGRNHRLYVDGRLEMETPGIFAVCCCHPIQIGSKGGAGAKKSFFSGRLADVRIYDRALSAEEIADLFQRQ